VIRPSQPPTEHRREIEGKPVFPRSIVTPAVETERSAKGDLASPTPCRRGQADPSR
jgi:hypothetical protein